MSAPPDTIRFGPLVYRVFTERKAVEKASRRLQGLSKGEQNTWGAFSDHRRAIIGVYGDEDPNVLRHSLLHEVLHCTLRLSGLWPNAFAVEWVRNPKNSYVDVEEHVVAGTAGPLLGVLRDNPDLVAWLMDGA